MTKEPKKPKTGSKKGAPIGQAAVDSAAAGKNPKKIVIVDRPTVERLAVDLTPEEVNAYARESARLHGDIGKTKQEAKDTAAEFKAKVGGMETRVSDLNRKIESGKEDREVACVWRINYEEGNKTLMRLIEAKGKATEYVPIKSYPLLPEERQMKLPIKETHADKVHKAEEQKTNGGDKGKDNVLEFGKEGPKPGDQTGTDEVRNPGGESEDERKVRIWCNSLTSEKRQETFGITEVGEANQGLLKLPYRRLAEADKALVRGHYQAYSEKQPKDKIPF